MSDARPDQSPGAPPPLEQWPHDLVRANGPDALGYLQSQLSQDLRPLAVGDQTWSFVLQPTGKVDALVHVTRTGDDAVELRVDRGCGEALVARLLRFKIRVQATVELEGSFAGDPEEYHRARVAAGWPAHGAEITEATIPAELPGVVAVAVSFAKGCYPGQELVERMDSRSAQAPRRLVRLGVDAGAQPGDPVSVDGVEVGRLTSVAGTSALALVKRGASLDDA